jgi:hypothetical protein
MQYTYVNEEAKQNIVRILKECYEIMIFTLNCVNILHIDLLILHLSDDFKYKLRRSKFLS